MTLEGVHGTKKHDVIPTESRRALDIRTLEQRAFEVFEDIRGAKLSYYQALYRLFNLGDIPKTVEDSKKKIDSVNGESYSAFADKHVERAGDTQMAKAILSKAVAHPDRTVKVLALGGGTTYPVTNPRDFNSDWFSRRMQRTGLPNLDILTTDLIPETTQDSMVTDFGFFYVPPTGKLFYRAFQTQRSMSGRHPSEEHELVSGLLLQPPASPLVGTHNAEHFAPVDRSFVEDLYHLPEVIGSRNISTRLSPVQHCMHRTDFDPRVEGSVYIRPLVDPVMESSAFDLKAKGGVNGLKLKEHFEEAIFDFIVLRHNGSYLTKDHLPQVKQFLRAGGELLYADNAYAETWVMNS